LFFVDFSDIMVELVLDEKLSTASYPQLTMLLRAPFFKLMKDSEESLYEYRIALGADMRHAGPGYEPHIL
jgi:hypothetical protein